MTMLPEEVTGLLQSQKWILQPRRLCPIINAGVMVAGLTLPTPLLLYLGSFVLLLYERY